MHQQVDLRGVFESARQTGGTAAVVSSFVLHPRFGLDRGFDHYEFEPSSPLTWRGQYRREFFSLGEETTQRAITWLTRFASQGDGRFFLWVHYFDPHFPYHPPARYQVSHDAPVDITGKELTDQIGSHVDFRRQGQDRPP